MKKLKLFFFILFLFFLVFTLTGCSNKDNNNKEKAVSEVKYLENRIINLANSINNIKYENYKITTSKIEEDKTSDSSKSTDKSNDNSSSENSKEGSSSGSQGGEKSQSNGESEQSESQSNNKYTLEKTSTLSNTNNDVDWKHIKNEVEIMYSSIPTITLDLYSLNTNQDEILNFNNELDKLTIAVKEENKEKTLIGLSRLYNYLPKYLDIICDDKTYTSLIKTKTNVINAYSILDTGDWNKISRYIDSAIEEYSNILNDIDDNSTTYSVNKGYIMLNELKNVTKLKDKEVFLIKYKNLLEEFNSI